MADRKYYVTCDSGCKFESMTKEQILTAITQAVNEGRVSNIDAGFITTIKTVNGTPLRFFVGTQSEYELLKDADRENLFAIITNDVAKEDFISAIDRVDSLQNTFDNFAKEISTKYMQNMGDYVCGIVGHYKLPSAGTYHIQFERSSAIFHSYCVDFGLVRWNGSDVVHTSADILTGESATGTNRYILQVATNGLVQVYYDNGSTQIYEDTSLSNIYVRRVF